MGTEEADLRLMGASESKDGETTVERVVDASTRAARRVRDGMGNPAAYGITRDDMCWCSVSTCACVWLSMLVAIALLMVAKDGMDDPATSSPYTGISTQYTVALDTTVGAWRLLRNGGAFGKIRGVHYSAVETNAQPADPINGTMVSWLELGDYFMDEQRSGDGRQLQSWQALWSAKAYGVGGSRGAGRRDLKAIADMGANTIVVPAMTSRLLTTGASGRTWAPAQCLHRSHRAFLDEVRWRLPASARGRWVWTERGGAGRAGGACAELGRPSRGRKGARGVRTHRSSLLSPYPTGGAPPVPRVSSAAALCSPPGPLPAACRDRHPPLAPRGVGHVPSLGTEQDGPGLPPVGGARGGGGV